MTPPRHSTSRSATSLPRGPHQLSRSQVEQSQRQRVKEAMVQVVGERGYANTSVAHIIAAAGVSRATFYQFYKDKDVCFLDAFDTALLTISSNLLQALASQHTATPTAPQALPSRAQLELAIGAYVDALAAHPAAARTFLVEVYAAGPAAIRKRQQSIDTLAGLMLQRFAPSASTATSLGFALQLFLHGVSSMVSMLVGSGRLDELPTLKAPLVDTALAVLASDLLKTTHAKN